MKIEEYIKKECKTCKNRENNRDLCEIRIDEGGEPKCVNLDKETDVGNEKGIKVKENVKEKTADEMFEKLGYTEINSKSTYIEYFKRADFGAYERIKFDKKNKRIVRDARTGQYNKAIRFIIMQELQAINKKVEELGWNKI